jgi:uncharacterized protein (TIGR04255 family)
MSKKLANFSNPPVIEVVLGVQFEPLGLTSGHLGWYWRECLGDEWPTIREVQSLPDQLELFDGNCSVLPPFGMIFQTSIVPSRLQISHQSNDRMIQVQDTRFIYNWIKKEDTYPRYDEIRNEFVLQFGRFQSFIGKIKKTSILHLNQWEVTYVNHVPSGEVWMSPADGADVFSSLWKRPGIYGNTTFETMSGEWQSEIVPKRGRLRINLHFQDVKQDDTANKLLVAQFTARGQVSEAYSWQDGLDLGHKTIVSAFVDVSADFARKRWGEC